MKGYIYFNIHADESKRRGEKAVQRLYGPSDVRHVAFSLFYSLSENPTTNIGKTIDDRVEKREVVWLEASKAAPIMCSNFNLGSHAFKIGRLRFIHVQATLSCPQEVDWY